MIKLSGEILRVFDKISEDFYCEFSVFMKVVYSTHNYSNCHLDIGGERVNKQIPPIL